jgi:hypothetical protein
MIQGMGKFQTRHFIGLVVGVGIVVTYGFAFDEFT